MQREVISSVETVLKSAAYIRGSEGGVGRSCDIMRASLPANLPWIRSLMIVGGDGRIQCATNNMFVGLDLSDRPYLIKARESRDFVFSDFVLAKPTNTPDRDGGLSGVRHQPGRRRRRSGRRQSRLDVEDHEQSRQPARRYRRAGRQLRHRAGGAGGSGQHDRPSAGYRAAAVVDRRKSHRFEPAGRIAFVRGRRWLETHGQLRAHRRHAIAAHHQHRRSQGVRRRSMARSAPPICSSPSSACSCCSARWSPPRS